VHVVSQPRNQVKVGWQDQCPWPGHMHVLAHIGLRVAGQSCLAGAGRVRWLARQPVCTHQHEVPRWGTLSRSHEMVSSDNFIYESQLLPMTTTVPQASDPTLGCDEQMNTLQNDFVVPVRLRQVVSGCMRRCRQGEYDSSVADAILHAHVWQCASLTSSTAVS